MTNEELKKKIVGILEESQTPVEYDDGDCGQTYFPTNEDVADALIAAGYGDVAEWKAKANDWKQRFESRDKQYNDGTVSSCKALQLKDEKIAKYKRRAEVAERALRNLAQFCAKGAKYYLQSNKAVKERERELYDEWINNAKKEISEEKNEQV